MRRQFTLIALALGAMYMNAGNEKAAANQNRCASKSMGSTPVYGPSKSRMIKNKIMRKRLSK